MIFANLMESDRVFDANDSEWANFKVMVTDMDTTQVTWQKQAVGKFKRPVRIGEQMC